jgi:hypothetical protein
MPGFIRAQPRHGYNTNAEGNRLERGVEPLDDHCALGNRMGPLFIAEFIRHARPDLDASSEGFGMAWGMGITVLCSLLAVILAVIRVIRLVVRMTK